MYLKNSVSILCHNCLYFPLQKVDGSRFLSLTKPDIMKLVNNKMGPCLKVENLLNLLKARMNPAQARFLANIRKPQN